MRYEMNAENTRATSSMCARFHAVGVHTPTDAPAEGPWPAASSSRSCFDTLRGMKTRTDTTSINRPNTRNATPSRPYTVGMSGDVGVAPPHVLTSASSPHTDVSDEPYSARFPFMSMYIAPTTTTMGAVAMPMPNTMGGAVSARNDAHLKGGSSDSREIDRLNSQNRMASASTIHPTTKKMTMYVPGVKANAMTRSMYDSGKKFTANVNAVLVSSMSKSLKMSFARSSRFCSRDTW